MTVVVFPRDIAKGEKICQALAGAYIPRLHVYRRKGAPLYQLVPDGGILVAVMAVGIVVRLLCPYLRDKWQDVPVVAVDSGQRFAVPVVGGHHGANELALYLYTAMGFLPAITTATESLGRPHLECIAETLGSRLVNPQASKAVNVSLLESDLPVVRLKGPRIVLVDERVAVLKADEGLVVGLGTRRGVTPEEILDALSAALRNAGREGKRIRLLVTAEIKRNEAGIVEAARRLGVEVVYLPVEVINAQNPSTSSKATDLGMVGVAEPCALALSTQLIMPKTAFGRVTIALGE